MNIICTATSRAPCLNPRTVLQKCSKSHSLAARLAWTSNNRFYTSSSCRPDAVDSCSRLSERAWKPQLQVLSVQRRSFGSRKIITRWEDLPKDYVDAEGLDYRTRPLSAAEVSKIFGKGMHIDTANNLLRVLHGRRVAGTLSDPEFSRLSGFTQKAHEAALAWLRNNVDVNEDYSAGMRAEQELIAMGEDIMSDSERIGLYKPNASPAPKNKGGDIHGVGVFERVRKAKEQAWEREQQLKEAARKKQAEEIGQVSGTLETVGQNRVELRRAGENPRLKYYLDRAKVLPDAPPEMSIFQRLWPSGLLVFTLVGGSILFAQVYTPMSHSARLFPEMPPAAATINAIIAANCIVFVLWRFPPAFRMLEKYFIAYPGYPRALSMLGNVFSHKSFTHLLPNMLVLWFAGTRLHEDVGRGNFLAIYFCSGLLGSFTSLSYFVARSIFVSSSLGASAALNGVCAAYLWLHHDEYMKFFGLPPDPMRGIPGSALLGFFLLFELISMARSAKRGRGFTYDHASHLGGFATGLIGAQVLRKQAEERKSREMERRKNMGLLDRIKEGRV